MASGPKKTTMAKLTRERKLRERREDKQAKKAERRRLAAVPRSAASETPAPEPSSDVH